MADAPTAPVTRATTAGGLLRQARQAQGLHIGALAAAIKVTQRKLELLESDQLDQLPDATFTRALAQTVCRTLKVDAAPILALLPPIAGHRLEHVAEGLNMPFADRPGRLVPKEWAKVAGPAVWLAALLVIAAIVVYAMPANWLPVSKPAETRAAVVPTTTSVLAPAAPASGAASMPFATVTETVSLPAPAASGAPMSAAAMPLAGMVATVEPALPLAEPVPNGVLIVHATAQSWVEVTDVRGKALLARIVQPGETIPLDGDMPMKVRIGNVGVTQLVLRGEPVDLAPFARSNMARFELK